MNEKSGGGIYLVIAAGLIIWNNMQKEEGGGQTPPDTTAPDSKLVAKLENVKSLAKANPAAAKKIGPFYTAAARLAADPQVRTAQELLDALQRAEGLKATANPDARMPGFGAMRDAFVLDVLGTKAAVPLTDEKRRQLVQAFQTIAWVMENPQ